MPGCSLRLCPGLLSCERRISRAARRALAPVSRRREGVRSGEVRTFVRSRTPAPASPPNPGSADDLAVARKRIPAKNAMRNQPRLPNSASAGASTPAAPPTPPKPRPRRLDAREKQVIALLAEGWNAAQIGRVFGCTRWAVYPWIASARKKLGARTLAHLVHLAHGTEPPVLPFKGSNLQWLNRRLLLASPASNRL